MFIDTTVKKIGDFAVYATLTGSYGERMHRMVGMPYKCPHDAAARAVRRHNEGGLNVEFVNLRTGKRVSVKELMQDVMETQA